MKIKSASGSAKGFIITAAVVVHVAVWSIVTGNNYLG